MKYPRNKGTPRDSKRTQQFIQQASKQVSSSRISQLNLKTGFHVICYTGR